MEWKKIPKDKDGFFIEDDTMYELLPIIVCKEYDGIYFFEYVDEDNWHDSVSDFSKASYKYYMPCEPIPND